MNLDNYALVCHKPLGDKGEDAYAFNFERKDLHAFGVFDGCGGSGAWKYPEFHNATGAFVAAHSIAKAFLEWTASLSAKDGVDSERLADQFHDLSLETLIQLKQSCAPMGVSGSLVKSFPCTASTAIVTQSSNGLLHLFVLNVGDSRVYVLTPDDGLIQLTKDDSRGNPDPLDNLRENAPLSDLLNADKPFRVKERQVTIPAPCAVMCATDGIFGFVRSPMDFEYLLLDSINKANTIAEFERLFRSAVLKLTGDDSTCIVAFYGFGSYQTIKMSFVNRLNKMRALVQAIDHMQHNPASAEKLIHEQWETYKRSTVYDEMQV